jgi:hypothetical protein
MTPIQLALMIFCIMLLLMVVRVPIAGAMFMAGTVGFIVQTGVQPYLNFLNNLAFALEKQGKEQEARQSYDQTLALDPGNKTALKRLKALDRRAGITPGSAS